MNFKDCFLQNNQHLADKWESYLDEYARLFAPYENKSVRILEIGVMNGGTLDVLAEYFKNATEIIGCDINNYIDRLKFDDPRVKIVKGDIKEVEIEGHFDIIIDDGSHLCSDVIVTFAKYFPKLNCGGLYIIEDLHASYWQGAGGGLHTPASSMAFLKRLLDYINQEHWRVPANPLAPVEALYNVKFTELETIHGIEFLNSLCVIRKSEHNDLGKRIVSGETELVTETGIWKRHNHGTHISNIPAEVKDDSQFDVFNLIELVRRMNASSTNRQ